MRLSERLKKSFNTVCFTETPLDQIKKLAAEDFPRKIRLKPYGLVFWREDMLDYGANPAVYLNGYGSSLRNYLLSEFDSHFNDISSIKTLKCKQEFYNEIISYYSLINVMSERHDFSWEREWRHNGNFKFKYHDLVAIVADDPDNFLEKCVKVLNKRKMSYLKRTPIISAHWSYEDVVEEMAIKIWQKNA
ncbi:hypothetical protein BQ6471_02286 [Vibrio gazogenes]|nr:hypothetical protein BQ6471_02286 [Vibrio gazogenes]